MDTNDSDNIFREKLGNFAAEPDPHVWDRIRHSLDKKQRKRLVPLWLPLGAAVAVVLLALWFTGPSSEQGPEGFPVTDTETAPANRQADESPASEADSETGISPETGTGLAESETNQTPPASGTPASEPGSPTRLQTSGALADSKQARDRSDATEDEGARAKGQLQKALKEAGTTDPAIAVSQRADSPVEKARDADQSQVPREGITPGSYKSSPASQAVTANTEPAVEDPETGKKSIYEVLEQLEAEQTVASDKGRWSMGPSIAPVYYNSFGNGSPIASTFMENSKSGTVNLSYGLSVAYEVSDRLSLRSGIHKVDFGYNTNEVSFTSTVAVRPTSLIRTISYSENSKNVVVHSTLNPVSPTQQEGAAPDITAASPEREGRMLQQFGYLEVPVELQYTLVDRQWGLNLIGGMSSLFLIDNSVSLDSNGTSTEIGEASNMNPLNFSTNLGLGVYYQLTPKWQVQVQPMVKMHLNTFNETSGSFRPYTVGVYSGMSFRF